MRIIVGIKNAKLLALENLFFLFYFYLLDSPLCNGVIAEIIKMEIASSVVIIGFLLQNGDYSTQVN